MRKAKKVDGDLEDMRQHMARRVRGRVHRQGIRPFTVEEFGGVRLQRVGQQLDDDVQQFGHTRAALGRHETHWNQVGFVQRLLPRRVPFGGGHFAVVQVAVDEVAVYLDQPLDERAVRGARRRRCQSRCGPGG